MESMKSGKCIKCSHPEVIKSEATDYAHYDKEHSMAVTAETRWIMEGRNLKYPYGVLSMYTCRRCGYTEWYADNPEEIPIGKDYKTEIIRFEEAEG